MNVSGFKLSERSFNELKGVHPKMIAVTALAMQITEVDFIVTDGLRTTAEQKELVARGASQTMKSKHLTGRAVDVCAYVNGKVRWEHALMTRISEAFFQAAEILGVKIEWGGHWKSFVDTPHYQLAASEK